MKIQNEELRKILAEGGYVDAADLEALEKESEALQTDLLSILYQKQSISKDLVGQAIAEYYKVPYWDLNTKVPKVELHENYQLKAGSFFCD